MFERELAFAGRSARMLVAGAAILGACAMVGAAGPAQAPVATAPVETAPAVEAPVPQLGLTPLARPNAIRRIFFANPAPGFAINSPFGLRQLPWEKRGRLHAGVDFAAPMGSKVVATTQGVVSKTGYSPSYGNFVEVSHGEGLTSFYAHLSKSAVREGMAVTPGKLLGNVGNTGASAGAHLHFELRRDGKPLDPSMFLYKAFADATAMPFEEAAKVSPKVRMASVSSTPAHVHKTSGGRVRGVIKG